MALRQRVQEIRQAGVRQLLKNGIMEGHNWLTPKVRSFEESPYIRLFAIAAVLAFPLQFLSERSDRSAEATARAWERLTTPASGNSGRIEAIQYLVSQGVSLPELDLSCETQGRLEDDGRCRSRVYLQGIDVSLRTTGNVAYLEYSDLSDADIRRSNFSDAIMNNINFSGATLFEANFQDAFLLQSSFDGTYIMYTNFSYADLTAADLREAEEVSSARFWRANLSGTQFPENMGSRVPQGFYYVKGHPPTGFSLENVNHFVCGSTMWPNASSKDLVAKGCREINP